MMMKSIICVTAVIGLSVGVGAASAQDLNEDVKLTANDGATGDRFGNSIAIDNGIVAVGTRRDDDHGDDSGSVYLFDAFTGVQIAKLTAGDGAAGDLFGHSIAIDNGIVAVGAHYDDDHADRSGSAYLFDANPLSENFGTQLAKLTAGDAAEFDTFGYSIAIDNGIVAIGSRGNDDHGNRSGSAYLFDANPLSANFGTQLFKLTASDAAESDQFGSSIAIDNGIVAVGAHGNDDHGSESGSAYLFNASTGAQIAKLTASDAAAGDYFGFSIAINNGIVAVGSRGDDDHGDGSGSAYLFDLTGAQLAKLTASDAAAGNQFGHSITINNGIVAVGAQSDDDHGTRSGSAYLFNASTGVQIAKLTASDGAELDIFGISIAIDNGIVAVGAYRDDDHGDESGSAYVFTVPTEECLADLLDDGTLDIFDVFEFIDLFNANDPIVDFLDDGVMDIFDVFAFIDLFNAGCP